MQGKPTEARPGGERKIKKIIPGYLSSKMSAIPFSELTLTKRQSRKASSHLFEVTKSCKIEQYGGIIQLTKEPSSLLMLT